MKLCPHCSSQLEDNAVRCGRCGKWVVEKRQSNEKKRTGSNPVRLLVLGAVAVLAYAVWALPESRINPKEILDLKPSRGAVFRSLASDLERLVALQEEHFRDHGEYSGTPEDLGFDASEGVTVSIIATPNGWSGAATYLDFSMEEGCAVYVGLASPPHKPISPRLHGIVECTE
jgi:hypothetical protein